MEKIHVSSVVSLRGATLVRAEPDVSGFIMERSKMAGKIDLINLSLLRMNSFGTNHL